MLTPGVSVKNVSFRREGFRKWESMNRKKTKNLLVLMVLSSAAAAGYLVFYNHEPGERELVDSMHIDGAIDGDQGAAHHADAHHHGRHRVDEDDDEYVARNQNGKMIGQKLFLHGVNKADGGAHKARVKSLAEKLRERLEERRKEQDQEVEVGMGRGAVNLEEKEEEEVAVEEKADGRQAIDSLRERLKLRLQERKRLLAEANAKAGGKLVGKKKSEERDWGVADKKEEAEDEVEEKKVVKEKEEEEDTEKAKDSVREGKVMSLIERLKARLAEQKKEKESDEDVKVIRKKTTVAPVEKDDDPFGPDDSKESAGESARESVRESARESAGESAGDDPFGPGGDEESEVKSIKKVEDPVKKKKEMRNIADIIYEKKYGVKRPKIVEDNENLIEPFDERAFNRKPKEHDDDNPMIRPVARPAVVLENDDSKEERRRQHIKDLNQVGDVEEGGMPHRQDRGMGAFQRKEEKNPFLKKKKFGGFDSGNRFDSGRKFDRNPFMKKKYSAFDAVKKAKNINDAAAFNKKKEDGFGAFNGRGRESIDDVGMAEKKADGFGAFRGGNRAFDSHDIPEPAKVPEKKENQFINAKGLLKGGGGNPVIRPFGNNGMNPFLDNGFEAGKNKNKGPIAMGENGDGRKIHFDFRNLDKKKKVPGLLVDEDEVPNHQNPVIQQGLPPKAPERNKFGEIPVPPPRRFGDEMGHANKFGEVPVPPPRRFGGEMQHANKFGEVPVAPPRRFGGEMQHANRFGEVPVPPPRRFGGEEGNGQAQALGRIPGLNQVPILHPDQLNQRLKEVPVAPPLRIAEQVRSNGGSSGGIQFHDLSKEVQVRATCQRYIYPAPVGSGQICIHKKNSDLVSDTIISEGSWEHQMVTELVNVLNSDWKLALIDIGAGIGMFSLCGALMHRQVVAIEPFYANYMALHKGAQVNNVDNRITLITEALDDSAYTGKISLATRDDGGYSNVHITKLGAGEILDRKRKVNVTTLNNLAQQAENLNFRLFPQKNVMKLDVTDNKEASILAHDACSEFFQKVDVHYILTHWRKSRTEHDLMGLMTAMARLRYQPQLSWNGDVIEMENMQMDQAYIVWVKVHAMGEI